MKNPRGGGGHTVKHARSGGSKKHTRGKAKHNPRKQPASHHHQAAGGVHVVATKAKSSKPRGLSLADAPVRAGITPFASRGRMDGPAAWDIPCCSAQAVAASLSLAVSDADILALHWAAGGGADAPVPILAALEAACGVGVAGVYPVGFAPVDLEEVVLSGNPIPHHCATRAGLTADGVRPGLILGVSLPGAHAVGTAGGWWASWGAWWPPAAFPDAVIEEAWEVLWPRSL